MTAPVISITIEEYKTRVTTKMKFSPKNRRAIELPKPYSAPLSMVSSGSTKLVGYHQKALFDLVPFPYMDEEWMNNPPFRIKASQPDSKGQYYDYLLFPDWVICNLPVTTIQKFDKTKGFWVATELVRFPDDTDGEYRIQTSVALVPIYEGVPVGRMGVLNLYNRRGTAFRKNLIAVLKEQAVEGVVPHPINFIYNFDFEVLAVGTVSFHNITPKVVGEASCDAVDDVVAFSLKEYTFKNSLTSSLEVEEPDDMSNPDYEDD